MLCWLFYAYVELHYRQPVFVAVAPISPKQTPPILWCTVIFLYDAMRIHFTPLYCTFHETTYSARNLLQKFFHCQWFLWKWIHAAPVVGVMYIASVFVSWYLKSVKTHLIICRHIENVAVGLVVFGDKGKCSISAVPLASVHYFSLHRCVPDKSPEKFSSFFFSQ